MDRLPEGWDAQLMHEDLYKWISEQPHTFQASVLCWLTRQDDRPLYVESCILWNYIETDDKSVYRLWHIFRHPHEQNNGWRAAAVTDSAIVSSRDFPSPPSSSDTLSFIKDSSWNWRIEDQWDEGWEWLDGAVCHEAWQKATGSDFPREQLEDVAPFFEK